MNVNLASKITGQFAPVLGGQFTRYIQMAKILSFERRNAIFN